MAAADFVKFLELVSKDAELQTRLNNTDGADGENGFAAIAVALGLEHGLKFSAEEVHTAMTSAFGGQPETQTGELSEKELTTVAGGVGTINAVRVTASCLAYTATCGNSSGLFSSSPSLCPGSGIPDLY